MERPGISPGLQTLLVGLVLVLVLGVACAWFSVAFWITH